MQQSEDPHRYWMNLRNTSNENQLRWERNTTGAYYRQELRLSHLPAEYRQTVASLPAVRLPSHHERQTDKFNLRDLRLTHLINLYISFYQCKYERLPSIISVSPDNMQRLEQQGFRHSIYRCELGVFLLFCDTDLDNDTIQCS